MERGYKSTTPKSSLYLKALLTCVENKSWKLSLPNDPFDSSTIETGDTLTNNMKEEKKKRWEIISFYLCFIMYSIILKMVYKLPGIS